MSDTESTRPPALNPPAAHPLVLFDGVCNLCNATVQWLIARDAEGRLRYASLQSKAAGAALIVAGVEDPKSLGDSIVFLDGAGVHVRSSAVIRIGAELGFPYTLGKIALLVPRPLRDAVYKTVARHRYRWFGRRDTCMRPTPELAALFLDADEPTIEVPADKEPTVEADAPATEWVKAWLVRLAVVYVVLYMLPFPFSLLAYVRGIPLIGDIPGLGAVLGWVIGMYGEVMTPLVTWVGATLFGVDATFEVTGSGDRTFNFVQLAVTAALALLGSALWTAWARGARISAKAFDVSRIVARYYLATTMLGYGWVKVFPLQFPMPGPDRLIQSFGDTSPMGLAWTFLGASAAYQIFSGICELIGAYLLFWRRTALLGALVSAAVMMNIMAINFFHDVPVKLFSSDLFLIAIFIAAPDLPRLVGLFGFNLPTAASRDRPFWTFVGRKRLGLMAAHLLLIGTITAFQITTNIGRARSSGFLMEESPLKGIYRVESFERDGLVDRENEDADRWVRVGINPPSAVTVQRATGESVRMRLVLDEDAGTLSLFDRGAHAPRDTQFHYFAVEPGLYRLEGDFEGARTVILLRRNEDGALLTGRRYHWINEFPFNR
jgi:predicted DCC family thiol-disulfide oxidoreductase YuxK